MLVKVLALVAALVLLAALVKVLVAWVPKALAKARVGVPKVPAPAKAQDSLTQIRVLLALARAAAQAQARLTAGEAAALAAIVARWITGTKTALLKKTFVPVHRRVLFLAPCSKHRIGLRTLGINHRLLRVSSVGPWQAMVIPAVRRQFAWTWEGTNQTTNRSFARSFESFPLSRRGGFF